MTSKIVQNRLTQGRRCPGGKVLKEMGYGQVYNLGAFKDWAEGGGSVDKLGPTTS